jgi:hypothetical protein
VNGESPDGFLRNAALQALGPLGDEKAVPLLREWAAPGKEIPSRQAAIGSLASLQKGNKEITTQIASYLTEPHFQIRIAAILALGGRGDASAIPALEALLKSNDLSIEIAPMVRGQIDRLKKSPSTSGAHAGTSEGADHAETTANGADNQRLAHLEELVREMNERLKGIEGRLPPAAKQ